MAEAVSVAAVASVAEAPTTGAITGATIEAEVEAVAEGARAEGATARTILATMQKTI